jgi:hypothetical protein
MRATGVNPAQHGPTLIFRHPVRSFEGDPELRFSHKQPVRRVAVLPIEKL